MRRIPQDFGVSSVPDSADNLRMNVDLDLYIRKLYFCDVPLVSD
jgi:hypothetical protein